MFQPPVQDNIIVEYGTTGGLFNQHACHTGAVQLAIAIGASTLEWPPARDRQTFAMADGVPLEVQAGNMERMGMQFGAGICKAVCTSRCRLPPCRRR
jgi:hypothetical protein